MNLDNLSPSRSWAESLRGLRKYYVKYPPYIGGAYRRGVYAIGHESKESASVKSLDHTKAHRMQAVGFGMF